MNQPDVYLVIGTSAIAFQEDGEILETVEWTADNRPDWTNAGICDLRGVGGAEGFAALGDALTAAERNARHLFDEVRRVPKDVIPA